MVKDKKKKSSGGSTCQCGRGACVVSKDMYTMPCAQRLGGLNDPHGVLKKATEKRRIKKGAPNRCRIERQRTRAWR